MRVHPNMKSAEGPSANSAPDSRPACKTGKTQAKTLAIIGTAGRKEDGQKLSREIFNKMCDCARKVIAGEGITHLISGGAAYADHVAVALALDGTIPAGNLTLYLPAALIPHGVNRLCYDASMKDGGTANYYHERMLEKTGIDGFSDLRNVISMGAKIEVNPAGFFARNQQVAEAGDVMLAFTFGNRSTQPD